MFKIYITSVLSIIIFFYGNINADTLNILQNKVVVDWGTNYYGNTASVSVSRKLTKHFNIGLEYGQGNINFQIKGPSTFWGVDFGNFEELNTNIDIDQMIDFVVYYNIHGVKKVLFLNTYGLGLSHYNLKVNQSVYRTNIDYRFSGYYSGSKYISGYATFASIDFLEWFPNKDTHFSLIWGGKVHIASITMPQCNTLSNGYDVITLVESGNDDNMFIFAPESSIRFNYYF